MPFNSNMWGANFPFFCSINRGSPVAKLLLRAKLIVWDEAPMVNKMAYEAVDRTLRDLTRRCDLPFGGIPMVLGGDFRQVAPVVQKGSAPQIVNASLSKSVLWGHFTVLRLKINMRVQRLQGLNATEQRLFAEFLLKVGDGEVPVAPGTEDLIQIPAEMLAVTQDAQGLITEIFGDLRLYDGDHSRLVECAILAPRNEDVDMINDLCTDIFPGAVRTGFDILICCTRSCCHAHVFVSTSTSTHFLCGPYVCLFLLNRSKSSLVLTLSKMSKTKHCTQGSF